MTTYSVSGYLTISVHKTIEAASVEEAREKAADLSPPSLCHHCDGAGADDPDAWTLNGFDDPPADVVRDIDGTEQPSERDAAEALARQQAERIRELEAELARARSGSLLRPAVTIDRSAVTPERVAKGAEVMRALREPCTVHNVDEDGICIKCERRIVRKTP